VLLQPFKTPLPSLTELLHHPFVGLRVGLLHMSQPLPERGLFVLDESLELLRVFSLESPKPPGFIGYAITHMLPAIPHVLSAIPHVFNAVADATLWPLRSLASSWSFLSLKERGNREKPCDDKPHHESLHRVLPPFFNEPLTSLMSRAN